MHMADDINLPGGDTPLVRLDLITDGVGGAVVAKRGSFHPASSVKDRIGGARIEDAGKAGTPIVAVRPAPPARHLCAGPFEEPR